MNNTPNALRNDAVPTGVGFNVYRTYIWYTLCMRGNYTVPRILL